MDPTLTALTFAAGAMVGVQVEKVLAARSARESAVCPVCLGSTDGRGTWEPGARRFHCEDCGERATCAVPRAPGMGIEPYCEDCCPRCEVYR